MSSEDSHQWFVYLMQCADGSFYTGVTTDLARRLRQHNGEIVGGAGYTRGRRPVDLAWSEACNDRSEAQKREYVVRRRKKKEKFKLAASCGRPSSGKAS